MPVIPGFNKDISLLSKDINDKINEPKHQRNLVLIIVCIALLLDNMLYMVIVPIIPSYLHKIDQDSGKITTTTLTISISTIPSTLLPKIPIAKSTKSTKAPVIEEPNSNQDDSDDDDDNEDYVNKGTNSGVKKKTTTTKKIPKGRVVYKSTPAQGKKTTSELFIPPIPVAQPPPAELVKPKDKDKQSKEKDKDGDDVQESEDVADGWLFASKAVVQLFINPFSGAFIDRIGYDIPMCIGLTVIFFSTMTFSLGNSYWMLLFARGLQGVGSAFADTSGLAMIADRFTEEGERTKALGIALAFISFGSLVAPPFGGILYEYIGRRVPFILLALLALFDGGMLFFVMRPHRVAMSLQQNQQYKPKGTPIWRLFMDPYIAVCAGALVMANISLAFLEPTIANWMRQTMNATESQMGLIWLPGFIPHLLGVLFTVWMSKKYPQYQWVLAASGLALEGVSCFLIPFCSNFYTIMIPISGICFGIALVDTAILPTLAYLVDVRHTSIYGSIYAIADISYSLAYAAGPIVAGNMVHAFGFFALNMGICFSNLAYTPALFFLRYFYEFKPLESNELSAISNAQSAVGGAGFKKFRNDEDVENQIAFNSDFTTAIDTGMMTYQNQGGVHKPQSSAFQSLQKYPKKQSKNPYKDTHNLIDNMDEDE